MPLLALVVLGDAESSTVSKQFLLGSSCSSVVWVVSAQRLWSVDTALSVLPTQEPSDSNSFLCIMKLTAVWVVVSFCRAKLTCIEIIINCAPPTRVLCPSSFSHWKSVRRENSEESGFCGQNRLILPATFLLKQNVLTILWTQEHRHFPRPPPKRKKPRLMIKWICISGMRKPVKL